MANFSNDSDLLAHDPNVFHELPFAGQTKLRVTDATVSGSTVTSTAGGFNRLRVGDVAMIGEGAYGVAVVVSNNSLTLAVAPVGVTGAVSLTVRTLAPQATLVHGELMRRLGMDPDDPLNEVDESDVLSVSLMIWLESLGTLSRAYDAAVTLAGGTRAVKEKAALYRQRYAEGLNGALVLLDTDGDGETDDVRRPGVSEWERV